MGWIQNAGGENVNVSCVASGKITDKRDRDRESYNKANDNKVSCNKADDSKVSCNKANDSKASDNKPCDSKASDSRYNATDTLCERLSKIDGMTSISYNINKENTNVILGKKDSLHMGQIVYRGYDTSAFLS